MTLRTLTAVLLAGASLAAFSDSASAQTVGAGYRFIGSTDISLYCGRFPSIAGFRDGSYLAFDGQHVDRRAADGTLLQTHTTLLFPVFSSFLRLSEDETLAYFGESSTGAIRELNLATGQVRVITSISFNFDLTFDVVPGLAYVSAATAGFGTNSVWRVDLISGATSEVVRVTGFSGPVEVDSQGDLFVSILDAGFPPAPGSARIVRFSAAQASSGVLLQEQNGVSHSAGFASISSTDYDAATDRMFVTETNSGGTGNESAVWLLDPAGQRVDQLAAFPRFAGALEFVDAGVGTEFGAYQPEHTSLRIAFSDCFGVGTWVRYNVSGARPEATFAGPGLGNSGNATIGLRGGIPNGAAFLWAARSQFFEPVPVVMQLGGIHPIALQAQPQAFVRRSAMIALDGQGEASVSYFQNVMVEGALLLQWLVLDPSGQLVTSSTFTVNRDLF